MKIKTKSSKPNDNCYPSFIYYWDNVYSATWDSEKRMKNIQLSLENIFQSPEDQTNWSLNIEILKEVHTEHEVDHECAEGFYYC